MEVTVNQLLLDLEMINRENIMRPSEVCIFDTETTGLTNHPTHGHPQVIELTYIGINEIADIAKAKKNINNFGFKSERFFPSMEISTEATNIHGIYKKQLEGCRASEEAKLPNGYKYYIAHNASYDVRCLGNPDIKTICTLKLARKLSKLGMPNLTFPKSESGRTLHSLDALINHYYHENTLLSSHHTSYIDCIKIIYFLNVILPELKGLDTWEKLYNFCQK